LTGAQQVLLQAATFFAAFTARSALQADLSPHAAFSPQQAQFSQAQASHGHVCGVQVAQSQFSQAHGSQVHCTQLAATGATLSAVVGEVKATSMVADMTSAAAMASAKGLAVKVVNMVVSFKDVRDRLNVHCKTDRFRSGSRRNPTPSGDNQDSRAWGEMTLRLPAMGSGIPLWAAVFRP